MLQHPDFLACHKLCFEVLGECVYHWRCSKAAEAWYWVQTDKGSLERSGVYGGDFSEHHKIILFMHIYIYAQSAVYECVLSPVLQKHYAYLYMRSVSGGWD